MSNQTSSWICPRRRALLFLVAPVILAGCTGTSRAVGSPRSSASPTGRATPTVSAIAGTPSPSASTSAATPSLAAAVVLSTWFSSPTYAISLVGGAGRVLASATATSPTIGILQVPTPTSESNTRVYYLDGNTTVRYLAPDGSTGVAAQVSAPSGSVVEFAVSQAHKNPRRFEFLPRRQFVDGLQCAGGQQHLIVLSKQPYPPVCCPFHPYKQKFLPRGILQN